MFDYDLTVGGNSQERRGSGAHTCPSESACDDHVFLQPHGGRELLHTYPVSAWFSHHKSHGPQAWREGNDGVAFFMLQKITGP
jgi:hypothetical protein